MKKTYLILFCFFCIAAQAQITDLTKLSKGKFYSSDIIKDGNNNIKGYFLLFESDKVSKEIYELEYIVLDENLNKVTSGKIEEMQFRSWLSNSKKITVNVTLYKNKLLVEFGEVINDIVTLKGAKPYQRYRILDITDNSMSKPFIYALDEMHVDPVFDRKLNMKSLISNTSEKILFYEGIGLVVKSQNYHEKEGIGTLHLANYDDNFKEIWRFNYSSYGGGKQKQPWHLASDKDVLVMFNHYMSNSLLDTPLPEISILFIDAKNGNLINEVMFPELDKMSYRAVDCVIRNDKVYVMGAYGENYKLNVLHDKNNIGIFKFIFDKTTGKLTDQKYFKWESLANELDITKYGKIKNEGYLFTHNMLLTNNGNIVAITETFEDKPVATNNMFFFELNDQMELKQMFTVEKFKNKYAKLNLSAGYMLQYGLFDFIDYQNLGSDEYLFFLNDNDKNSNKKKKSTQYGIVSYSDGVFKRQTLDLKTENSTISPYNAKKGYIMLVEDFDDKNKPTEYRLEKINY